MGVGRRLHVSRTCLHTETRLLLLIVLKVEVILRMSNPVSVCVCVCVCVPSAGLYATEECVVLVPLLHLDRDPH
ncbi:hypothetical protein ACRRTK_015823 [Alexandromys fortis]